MPESGDCLPQRPERRHSDQIDVTHDLSIFRMLSISKKFIFAQFGLELTRNKIKMGRIFGWRNFDFSTSSFKCRAHLPPSRSWANEYVLCPYLYCVCTWEKSTSHAGTFLLTYRSSNGLHEDNPVRETCPVMFSATFREVGDIITVRLTLA